MKQKLCKVVILPIVLVTIINVFIAGRAYAANYETALFPARKVQVTCLAFEHGSVADHANKYAIDLSGSTGDIYAPFTGRVVYVDKRWGFVLFQSENKVYYADGSLDYMTIGLMHDSDVSDLDAKWKAGELIEQGTPIYQPGGWGYKNGVSGNYYAVHVHMLCHRGKYNQNLVNSTHYTEKYGNMYPFDALYINKNISTIVNLGKLKSGNQMTPSNAYTDYSNLWKYTTNNGKWELNPPEISNVQVTDISPSGYTITCNVSDESGIMKVAFPTWTIANDQDDIFANWDTTALGTVSNGVVSYRVNTSEHNNEKGCTYLTHIYAYDTKGNVRAWSHEQCPVLIVDVPLTTGLRIDENHFPDANLRKVVSTKDTNQDGYLQDEEIASVNGFTVGDCSDFTGIEYFSSLKTLQTYNNSVPLKKLNLDQNQNLKTLRISTAEDTYISDGTGSRRELEVYPDSLKQLVLHNPKLETLYISSGALQEVNVDECVNLKILTVHGSNIKGLSLTKNTMLEELTVSGGEMESASMSSNIVTKVNYYMNVNTIEIDSLPNLKELTIKRLHANSIKLKNLSKLSYFELGVGDGLGEIGKLIIENCPEMKSFFVFDALKEIILKDCPKLNSITVLSESLTELDLTNNTPLLVSAAKNQPTTDNKGYLNYKDADKNARIQILPSTKLIYERISVDKVFKDVKSNAWYLSAVQYVYDNSIMSGKGDGIFAPNNAITRDEFSQMLYNHIGKPAIGANVQNPFPDVKSGKWYTNAILWAKENGIVKGNGDGTFGVGNNITREQLALMLYKYAQLRNYTTQAGDGTYTQFKDANKISSWAKEAIDWAVTNGIIGGKGEKNAPKSEMSIDPKGNATRAECAQMMKKLLQLAAQ